MALKRVRFSYEEPDPDDDEQEDKPRKLRFPKRKKSDATIEHGDEGDGVPVSKDARVAARERAVRRNVMEDEQLRAAEDDSDIHDVTHAEEDYVPNDDGDDAPKEPFNLNAERRDGYFDDDGHYVEYATKYEARDAWLDSVEVDERIAAKHFSHSNIEEPEPEMTPNEIAELKRRIASVLQPGETILEALRRLRGSSAKEGNRRGRLTGETKVIFDQLTEDAMKLMDNGETDVYEIPQEKFRREADAILQVEKEAVDIFADDEDEGETKPVDIFAEDEITTVKEQSSTNEDTYSGYVFDDTSGYYYNAAIGYYYDPNSGLYCSGESGKWLKFDEETNTYLEAA